MERPPKSGINNFPYERLTGIFDFYRQDVKGAIRRIGSRLRQYEDHHLTSLPSLPIEINHDRIRG